MARKVIPVLGSTAHTSSDSIAMLFNHLHAYLQEFFCGLKRYIAELNFDHFTFTPVEMEVFGDQQFCRWLESYWYQI